MKLSLFSIKSGYKTTMASHAKIDIAIVILLENDSFVVGGHPAPAGRALPSLLMRSVF